MTRTKKIAVMVIVAFAIFFMTGAILCTIY